MNMLSITAALVLAGVAGSQDVAPSQRVPTCDVVTHPREYQEREFTIVTDLVVDMRHRPVMNFEADPSCGGLLFAIPPGTQAEAAYREIEDAMLGLAYARKYNRRSSEVWLHLSGIQVRATGAMVCGSVTDGRCVMHVTELQDVVYPSDFPSEMRP